MSAEPEDASSEEADRFLRAVIDATDGRLDLPAPHLPPPVMPPALPPVPATASSGDDDAGRLTALSTRPPATELGFVDAAGAAMSLPQAISPHHAEPPMPPAPRRRPLTWTLAIAAVSLSALVIWWTELEVQIPEAAGSRLASSVPAAPAAHVAMATPARTAPTNDMQPPAEPDAVRRLAQAARLPEATATAPIEELPRPQPPALRVIGEIVVEAGATAPFPIAVEPAALATGRGQLVVRGLPDGAHLSNGRAGPSGGWVLAVTDMRGLAVAAAPAATAAQARLEIELRSAEGTLLAAAQTSLVIRPPSAAPAMSDPTRVSEATLRQWLEEGRKLIAQGSIAAARLILERAADNGSGQAALLLGDTFDPAKLYVLGVRGMNGDVKLAVRWYERADELGEPLAKARLAALASP